MKRSILAWLTATLLLAAGPAAAQTKMIIGTGIDPSLSLFYVAEGGGFFKKNGLDVNLTLGSSGSEMVALVGGNQLQAALGSELASIQTHNLNPNVVIISGGSSMPSWSGIVARDAGDLTALKGKKVGVQRASGSEMTWLAILDAKHLENKDYQVVYMDPPEMVAALERGDINAFSAFEPWVTRATLNVPGSKLIADNQGIFLPTNFVVMNKAWVEANQAATKSFLKALFEASEYCKSHPNESIDIVSKKLKLDPALAGALFKKIVSDIHLDRVSVDTLTKAAANLAKGGKLTKPLDLGTLIYSQPLRSVDAGLADASIP